MKLSVFCFYGGQKKPTQAWERRLPLCKLNQQLMDTRKDMLKAGYFVKATSATFFFLIFSKNSAPYEMKTITEHHGQLPSCSKQHLGERRGHRLLCSIHATQQLQPSIRPLMTVPCGLSWSHGSISLSTSGRLMQWCRHLRPSFTPSGKQVTWSTVLWCLTAQYVSPELRGDATIDILAFVHYPLFQLALR